MNRREAMKRRDAMSRSRIALAVVGFAVFLLGSSIVLAPSTAGLIPIDAVVQALGGPYVFVAAFGVVAFAVLVAVMLGRAVRGLDESTPPDPEEVYRVPHPGQRFDAFVDGGVNLCERVFGDRHERTRGRVRRTALSTLMRVEGLSRAEAKTALERGTWTDDAAAAAFLADGGRPGVGERLAAAVHGESTFQRGARRAADAVARCEAGGHRYDDQRNAEGDP